MSKTTEATAALEAAFLRSVPSSQKKRLNKEEWERSLQSFLAEAHTIRRRYSLGFFTRARTTYLLQQRLIALGVETDAVRKVIFALVLNSFSGRE